MSASSPNSVFLNKAGNQIYFKPTELISWDDFQRLQALLRQYPSFLAHRDDEILKNMILRCSEDDYESLTLQTSSWMKISRVLMANHGTRRIGLKLIKKIYTTRVQTKRKELEDIVETLKKFDDLPNYQFLLSEKGLTTSQHSGPASDGDIARPARRPRYKDLFVSYESRLVARSIVYGHGYDQRQKKEAKIMILKKVALGQINLSDSNVNRECRALLNKNLGLFARKETQSLKILNEMVTYQNTTLRMSALILKHSAFSRQEKESAKVEILKALFSNQIAQDEKEAALRLLDIRLDKVFHRGMNGSFAWTCSRTCFEAFSKMQAESDPGRDGANTINQQAVQAAKSVSKNLFLVLCDKAKVKCPEAQLRQLGLS